MPPRVIQLGSKNGQSSPLSYVKKSIVIVPPSRKPIWREERIELEWLGKNPTRIVEARVHGGVAVYKGIEEDTGKWVVTSVSLRLSICKLKTEPDAIRLAEYLEKTFPNEMRVATKERALSRLPAWFKNWCVGMKETGVWTDPPKE